MTLAVILIAVGCLAYANGANDNFKGVATLFGSGTTNYRGALTWATIMTFLGSLSAVFLARKLLQTFSGKGLVADSSTAGKITAGQTDQRRTRQSSFALPVTGGIRQGVEPPHG